MPTLLQKTVLCLALPLTGILLYLLLRSDEEEDDSPVVTTKQVAIKVKVPKEASGAIIGPQGCRIRKIQETTRTRVNFEDEVSANDDERTIIIRGTPQNAQLAELEIRRLVAEIPAVEQVDIFIPSVATGRVIGKGGETIRYLSRVCKAKIMVDRADKRRSDGLTKVTIRGSADAIASAKAMIEEKVSEENACQAKRSVINANRQHRGSKQASPGRNVSKDEVDDSSTKELNGAVTNGTASPVRLRHDDYMQVYVSAVEHPGHFWLQVLTDKANVLDDIGNEMTNYYGRDNLGQVVNYETLQVNDLVAAPFDHDERWYRAKVLEKQGDQADLYYVDYGDNGLVHKSKLKKLRGDYLCLPFQALECSLAKVKSKGDEWSDEAIDAFEELTYTGQWRVLMAKSVMYKNAVEGQSVPAVQLIDTNGSEDVDVAKELIKRNVAAVAEEEESINKQAVGLSPEKSSVSQVTTCENQAL